MKREPAQETNVDAQDAERVRPEAFWWNAAGEITNEVGPERATVLGLALISQQLDYLISLLAHNDGGGADA